MSDTTLPSPGGSFPSSPDSPPDSVQSSRPPSSIVFGVLGLIAAGFYFSCIGGLIPLFVEPEDRFDELFQQMPIMAIHVCLLMVGQLVNLLLLAGSIGLLVLANWGRILLIWYACVAPLVFVVHFIALATYVYVPTTQSLDRNTADIGAGFILVHLGLGGPLLIVFPIVLFIFMVRPSFRVAIQNRMRKSQT